MKAKEGMMGKRTLRSDQSGMVALMVAVFLIIIMSLIVVNYTRIVRREQRQTLDRQLNTQAFYAAESGINDAERVIDAALLAGGTIPEKSTCDPDGVYVSGSLENVLDSDSNVSYSCLLVDPDPSTLEFENISTDGSTVFVMSNAAGGSVGNVDIAWRPTDASGAGSDLSGCPNSGQFPEFSAWNNCDFGVMRIDLVPLDAPSRSNFQANTITVFGVPQRNGSGGSTTVTSPNSSGLSNQGAVVQASCGADSGCQIQIAGLNNNRYGVRLMAMYRDAKVSMSHPGSGFEFAEAQAMIDATGKANDVLRRVQVRKSLSGSNGAPDFAIQTADSLCKRLLVSDTSAQVSTVNAGTIDVSACAI